MSAKNVIWDEKRTGLWESGELRLLDPTAGPTFACIDLYNFLFIRQCFEKGDRPKRESNFQTLLCEIPK